MLKGKWMLELISLVCLQTDLMRLTSCTSGIGLNMVKSFSGKPDCWSWYACRNQWPLFLVRAKCAFERPSERDVREKWGDASVSLLSSPLSVSVPSSSVTLSLPQYLAAWRGAPVFQPGWHIQRIGRVPGRPSAFLGGEQLGEGGLWTQWPHAHPAELQPLSGQWFYFLFLFLILKK